MNAPATEALARFIVEAGARSLPAEVLARTREVVRDGAAALLAAANPVFSTGRLIADFARGAGGAQQASVVGHGFKTDVVNAALANGTMGYACDFEPHHPEAILHPIAVLLPTALALAEARGRSGADLLAAVAVGCEVEYRVSMALGPTELYGLGFHPSAVCGAFGATAAAANLSRLDAGATVRALGLAACQASGLMAWESDPSENARPFQMGMAARNGVTAALLAGQGFGGPVAVFDRGHTVYHAFSRAPRPERLLAGLGRTFDGVMELAIKPYPCVSFLHPALDALLEMVDRHRLTAGNVSRIEMRFARSGTHCIDGNPLKSHCAQYVLAVALARGRLEVADLFADARESDPAIAALSERIEVVADNGELEAMFPDFYACRLKVSTADGNVHEAGAKVARGYPETPLGQAALEAKFRGLAGSVASAQRVDRLWAELDALERAESVAALAALLGAPVGE
jgi:2-methylcitrate dehydratase PrpD